MAHGKFHLLKEIDEDTGLWKIKVRVIYLWKENESDIKKRVIHMILMDKDVSFLCFLFELQYEFLWICLYHYKYSKINCYTFADYNYQGNNKI
jgi:hypothetical protein